MTGRIWFACCAPADYAEMLREVKGRDERAQLLRFGDVSELGGMAARFPAGGACAALFARGDSGEEVVRAVEDLSRAGRTEQLLVFVDRLDAGRIARLFHAGATEVIAAEGATAPRAEQDRGRMEGERAKMNGRPSAPRDGVPSERGREPGEPEAEMVERYAACAPSPVGRAAGGPAGTPARAGGIPDGEVPPWRDLPGSGTGAARARAVCEHAARESRTPSCELGCAACAEVIEYRPGEAGPIDHGGSGPGSGGRLAAAPADPDVTGTMPAGRYGSEEGSAATTAAVPAARMAATARDGAARAGQGKPAVHESSEGSDVGDDVPAVSGQGPGPGAPARHRAPVVTAISGRGGVGKTTLLASMASCAASMGLRSAVLDLDLMFGSLPDAFGIEEPVDLGVIARVADGTIADGDIEGSAMRVGPGLTLWGPVAAPEQAELLGKPVEQLIAALRGLADVIFVDTSVYWGDAAAAAVAACDRCLVVGGAGPSACASATRSVALATRLGVPRTKMTSVVNRFGSRGCGEEFALRFEMAVSLRSKARIADGGDEVSEMLSFGRASDLAAGKGAFAASVRAFTMDVLRELGCPVEREPAPPAPPRGEGRPRIRLPWKQRAGEAA